MSVGILCFSVFFNSSFCYTWPFGVQQGANCELVLRRWWHWNVTSHGGGGARTPQEQSVGLSLCKPPPSSGDWVKTSKGRLPTGYLFPCF